MRLDYRNFSLTYEPPIIQIADRRGRELHKLRTAELPQSTRRMLRQRRRELPAVLLAILQDTVHPDQEPSKLLYTRDKTYVGCRDALYQLALHWNLKLQPTFVPRPRPVDIPQAFGGQGALSPFRDVEVTIYFDKESGLGRLRLHKEEEAEAIEFPLGVSVEVALHYLVLFIYTRTEWDQDCDCSRNKTVRGADASSEEREEHASEPSTGITSGREAGRGPGDFGEGSRHDGRGRVALIV